MSESLLSNAVKRWIAIGLAVTVLVVGASIASMKDEVVWSEPKAPSVASPLRRAAPPPPAPASTQAAAPAGDMSANGVVRSRDQAVLAARLTALITQMPFEAGQSFGKGQVLVAFDCSQVKAQLKAADAAAAAHRTTYDTNVELDQYKAIGTNDVLVSRANLAKAVAEAEAIRESTRQCLIAAPFDGTVVEKQAHRHDIVTSGQPLLTIQRRGDLEVELIVPSRWMTWLRRGSRFAFRLEETGKSIEGRVARLGAIVDPVSKTLRVTGAIDLAGETVLPGMSGVARFAPQEARTSVPGGLRHAGRT